MLQEQVEIELKEEPNRDCVLFGTNCEVDTERDMSSEHDGYTKNDEIQVEESVVYDNTEYAVFNEEIASGFRSEQEESHSNQTAGDCRERPFGCHKCGVAFMEKRDLALHFDTKKHTGLRSYKCSKCSKEFTRHFQLRKHMKKYVNHYKCRKCGEWFKLKSHLIQHMRIHASARHSEVDTRRDLSSEHNANTKNDEIKVGESVVYDNTDDAVVNEEIDSGFKSKPNEIQTSHTAGDCSQALDDLVGQRSNIEKPFGCYKCGVSFKTKGSLDKHYKSKTPVILN